MTLTQLTYVVALAEHGHFGRAADACHVSQPALSVQVQKLEEELSVTLFDRSQSPVRPTEVGERVIVQAAAVLAERDRIGEVVHAAAHTVAGPLRLGLLPTVAPYVLPLVAGPFQTCYPEVDLVVRERTTEALLDDLDAGRLDAGLLATPEERPGLEMRMLYREPFVAYVAADHPLPHEAPMEPKTLAGERLWLLSEGHCFRDQVVQACGQRAPGDLHFESGNLETLRLLVDHAGGVTLLPFLATCHLSEVARQQVRRFTRPPPHRDVRLLYRHASLKQARIDAFAEVLTETVTPLLPTPAADAS